MRLKPIDQEDIAWFVRTAIEGFLIAGAVGLVVIGGGIIVAVFAGWW